MHAKLLKLHESIAFSTVSASPLYYCDLAAADGQSVSELGLSLQQQLKHEETLEVSSPDTCHATLGASQLYIAMALQDDMQALTGQQVSDINAFFVEGLFGHHKLYSFLFSQPQGHREQKVNLQVCQHICKATHVVSFVCSAAPLQLLVDSSMLVIPNNFIHDVFFGLGVCGHCVSEGLMQQLNHGSWRCMRALQLPLQVETAVVEPLKNAMNEEQWRDYKAGLAAQAETEKQAQEAAEQQRQQAEAQAAAELAAQQAESERQSKLTKASML